MLRLVQFVSCLANPFYLQCASGESCAVDAGLLLPREGDGLASPYRRNCADTALPLPQHSHNKASSTRNRSSSASSRDDLLSLSFPSLEARY